MSCFLAQNHFSFLFADNNQGCARGGLVLTSFPATVLATLIHMGKRGHALSLVTRRRSIYVFGRDSTAALLLSGRGKANHPPTLCRLPTTATRPTPPIFDAKKSADKLRCSGSCRASPSWDCSTCVLNAVYSYLGVECLGRSSGLCARCS